MSGDKINLGQLLELFEEAFYAGWNAAWKAEYGEEKETAFRDWVEAEVAKLFPPSPGNE
jgi:hypothetical protein